MNKKILGFALENALRYNGKANVNAVIGRAFSELQNIKKIIVIKEVKDAVKEVNSWSLEKQRKEYKKFGVKKKTRKGRIGLPELPHKGKVVMRVEISPSGALHIGHAIVLLLNSEYCKKYRGKLIIRVSDTNPENIYPDAYRLIKQDANWMTNNRVNSFVVQSDRLKTYYKYAEKLIKLGKGYICTCKNFKFYADNRTECPCRKLDVEENLKRWKNMFKEKEGYGVLRVKTDILHPNPAIRDWPAFRINKHKHPRQGKKYTVWPLMNFAVVIDDHLSKMSHIIRAKDHIVNTERQKFLYKHFGWKEPMFMHIGRVNFKDFKISASKTRELIKKGKYKGWDDIRLPFLQSFRRRGLKPDAFVRLVHEMGLSRVDKVVRYHEFMDKIYAFNRDLIDDKTDRYFFVWNPKKIRIKNAPEMEAKATLHPDYPKRGYRKFKTKDQFYICDELSKATYRFMHLFNFKDNKFISKEYKPELNAKLIHWLPVSDDLVKVKVLNDDGKMTKGLGEAGLRKLKVGDIVQLERFGFVKLDKKNKSKLEFWWLHR